MITAKPIKIYYPKSPTVPLEVDYLTARFPDIPVWDLFSSDYNDRRELVLRGEGRVQNGMRDCINTAEDWGFRKAKEHFPLIRFKCWTMPSLALRVECFLATEQFVGEGTDVYEVRKAYNDYNPFGNYASTASDVAVVYATPRKEQILEHWGYTNRWLHKKLDFATDVFLIHRDQTKSNQLPILHCKVLTNEYTGPNLRGARYGR